MLLRPIPPLKKQHLTHWWKFKAQIFVLNQMLCSILNSYRCWLLPSITLFYQLLWHCISPFLWPGYHWRDQRRCLKERRKWLHSNWQMKNCTSLPKGNFPKSWSFRIQVRSMKSWMNKLFTFLMRWFINHLSLESFSFESLLCPVCGTSYLGFFYDA